MSKLLSHLSNVLEIPKSYRDLTVSEARSKLMGTYMIINGKLYNVARFDGDLLECYTAVQGYTFYGDDIKSIQCYLPDSGCYYIDGEYKYLQKQAKRQWRKSFSWSYYTLSNSHGESDVFKLFGQSPSSMYINNERVFYRTMHIATQNRKGEFDLHMPSMKYELDNFLNNRRDSA